MSAENFNFNLNYPKYGIDLNQEIANIDNEISARKVPFQLLNSFSPDRLVALQKAATEVEDVAITVYDPANAVQRKQYTELLVKEDADRRISKTHNRIGEYREPLTKETADREIIAHAEENGLILVQIVAIRNDLSKFWDVVNQHSSIKTE